MWCASSEFVFFCPTGMWINYQSYNLSLFSLSSVAVERHPHPEEAEAEGKVHDGEANTSKEPMANKKY